MKGPVRHGHQPGLDLELEQKTQTNLPKLERRDKARTGLKSMMSTKEEMVVKLGMRSWSRHHKDESKETAGTRGGRSECQARAWATDRD